MSEVASPDANDRAGRGPLMISVMLIVDDAAAAVAWYKRALGAEELWDLGGVAGLQLAGAPFFLHEVNPTTPQRTVPADSASRAHVSRCSSMTPTG